MVKVEVKNTNIIRLEIAKKGMSMRSFSKMIGVSQGYLSQILSGKKNPSPIVAYKISNGLDSSVDEFFFIQSD